MAILLTGGAGFIGSHTALALLEMLACGTTSFSDMYFFPWEAAELVAVCGIKANLCYPVQAFDPVEPYEKNESARKLERFYKDWHNAAEGRIRVDGCLHAEYTCNPHVAAGTAAWCRQNGVRMHIHLSETKSEHDTCIEKYGKTPAAWMNDLGVFDVPCAAAHCVWVTAEDRALLREKNVSVIHNPTSNMKLGSGFAPVKKMLEAGIRVGIGTDGAASNNNLNMMEEMQRFVLLQKGITQDATSVSAKQALHIATTAGARAMHTGGGVLKEGYKADIVLVDTHVPHMQPMHNAINNLVYAAQGSDVWMNMVDGKILYKNGEYKRLDIEKVIAETNKAAEKWM